MWASQTLRAGVAATTPAATARTAPLLLGEDRGAVAAAAPSPAALPLASLATVSFDAPTTHPSEAEPGATAAAEEEEEGGAVVTAGSGGVGGAERAAVDAGGDDGGSVSSDDDSAGSEVDDVWVQAADQLMEEWDNEDSDAEVRTRPPAPPPLLVLAPVSRPQRTLRSQH